MSLGPEGAVAALHRRTGCLRGLAASPWPFTGRPGLSLGSAARWTRVCGGALGLAAGSAARPGRSLKVLDPGAPTSPFLGAVRAAPGFSPARTRPLAPPAARELRGASPQQ